MRCERHGAAATTAPGASAGRPPADDALVLDGAELARLLAAVLEHDVPFRFAARGRSMHPFIRSGDVLTLSPLHGRAPRRGDVVAGRSGEDRLVVHRVVGVAPGAIELRGDNSWGSDGWFRRAAVLGIVTEVERAGRAIRLGTGPEGAAVAALSRAGILRPLIATLRPAYRAARRLRLPPR